MPSTNESDYRTWYVHCIPNKRQQSGYLNKAGSSLHLQYGHGDFFLSDRHAHNTHTTM